MFKNIYRDTVHQHTPNFLELSGLPVGKKVLPIHRDHLLRKAESFVPEVASIL